MRIGDSEGGSNHQVNDMITACWADRFRKLEAMESDIERTLDGLEPQEHQLGPCTEIFKELVRASDDVQAFLLLFYAGLERTRACAVSGTSPIKGSAEEYLFTWVAMRDVKRQAALVAANQATFLTAAAERFTAEVARKAAPVPNAVMKKRHRDHYASQTSARLNMPEFLVQRFRPTAEAGGRSWTRNLKALINADLDPLVAEAIGEMIGWRNDFIHANCARNTLVDGLTGGVAKVWALATRGMGVVVSAACAKHLERAAACVSPAG